LIVQMTFNTKVALTRRFWCWLVSIN